MSENVLTALNEGPARLSRHDVASLQRRRLVAAMVASVAEKGYARTSVADVVAGARVSRATFYEQFPNKTACFVSAYQACVDDLVGRLRDEAPSSLAPREQLRKLLATYLGTLSRFPESARVCLVEVYAAGPEAVRQKRKTQLDFARTLRDVHGAFARAGETVRMITPFELEALVGAISSLVTNRVGSGEHAKLPAMLPQVEALVLTFFGLHST